MSLATAILLTATVLPLWKKTHWVIRGMDFPRLQLSIAAIVLLCLQLLILDLDQTGSIIQTIIVILCLLWQLSWIVEYTRLWPVEVKSSKAHSQAPNISILTANVLTTNRNAGALLELVQQHMPDVLVTLESDSWWQQQLDVLEDRMKYTIKCPLDNLYGMHVYSRLPLNNVEIRYLVEADIPSMHALLKLPTGDDIRVHFLHPAPPSPTENDTSSERDAEIIMVAKSIAECNEPTIVTGDLNDVAWSSTTRLFRKISGLLDPRIGRGMFNTFNAKLPFIRWPLDHLFHSDHFTLSSIQRLPAFGSDHFALLTQVSYIGDKELGQSGLNAEAADRAEARSTIQREDANSEEVPNPIINN